MQGATGVTSGTGGTGLEYTSRARFSPVSHFLLVSRSRNHHVEASL